ncbi:ATP-binding cassette domain-containing protein [Patulibacter defluvii]|uniref:ATP-binding cassette domain-containing protein n=1 Tax=Patulibacter defluvii TaxID=3095358 RepID=UPI002A759F3C|nr:ATP-binding cassette domain-containing protein [Patulibacter sp. DM4]
MPGGEDEIEVVLRPRGRLAGDPSDPALLIDGRRIAIPAGGLVVGTDPAGALALGHAAGDVHEPALVLDREGPRVRLRSLDARTGVVLGGERLAADERWLADGERLEVGGHGCFFVGGHDAGDTIAVPGAEPPAELVSANLALDRDVLRLGSDPGCDVVLAHPTVSPLHAEIRASPGRPGAAVIRDRSGSGAALRVNGALVRAADLRIGDEIAIGPYRLIYDGALLHARADAGALRLDAEGVSVTAGERTILQPTWLSVRPGELVAIIGESGAGKSTLMTALCGVRRASGGRVTVNGEPLETRLGDIGFVPQDDIVHRDLTVSEALGYAAELRLPQDASRGQRDAAVAQVLEEVGLSAHADQRIGALSGGQRKRVGVATELVSRPGLLFLDEPTTGLDAGLERRLMTLLRELADAGRGVMLVTHATRSLHLCDKLCVMGRGGVLCYLGPPGEALAFFGVTDADEIYDALDRTPADEWHRRFLESVHARASWDGPVAGGWDAGAARRPRPRLLPQWSMLTRRYVALTLRDRRTLITNAAQVPVLALLTAVLFHGDVFGRDGPPAAMEASASTQLLFLVVTISIWFGAIGAAREIVKERAVLRRELAVGARVPAYVLSKLAVQGVVVALQVVALAAIVFGLRPLDEGAATVATVVGLLVVSGLTAVTMGLVVSALARSEDQASSFIPLILVPQLLFSGALVSVAQMTAVLKPISGLAFAQWSFAGVGSAIDMNDRIARDPVFARASRYGSDFFALAPGAAVAILVAFGLLFAVAAGVLVDRRVRHG